MDDKLKHFIIGFTLGILTSILNHEIIGFVFSSLLFFGKEVFDIYKENPTGFDKYDIKADYNGFLVGYGISALIKNVIL